MTKDHLATRELVVRSLGHCLPRSPIVQYDYFTQLVHREYVLMEIEKDLWEMIGTFYLGSRTDGH